jgi:hypothetical protein
MGGQETVSTSQQNMHDAIAGTTVKALDGCSTKCRDEDVQLPFPVLCFLCYVKIKAFFLMNSTPPLVFPYLLNK